MRIELDDSELRNLEIDLSKAPLRAQFGVTKFVRRGAALIDEGMQQDAAGHRYLKHLPKAVSHEMLTPYLAEIGLGPKRGTQGALAHIIVYGSVNNAPVYDHTAALRRSAPTIEGWAADEAEESVFGYRGYRG